MKTTKERLAAAIQTPFKDSLAFYHTSLKGLDKNKSKKTVTYMVKTPLPRVKRIPSLKRFMSPLSILSQSFCL